MNNRGCLFLECCFAFDLWLPFCQKIEFLHLFYNFIRKNIESGVLGYSNKTKLHNLQLYKDCFWKIHLLIDFGS